MSEPAAAAEPEPPILAFEQIGPDAFRLTVIERETIRARAAAAALREFIEARLGSAFHRSRKPT